MLFDPVIFSNETPLFMPLYQKALALFSGSLLLLMLLFRKLRNKHHTFLMAYRSFQSWFIAALPFFLIIALPSPWFLIGITFLAIASNKSFFQLMGVYHRSYFLFTCYVGIFFLAACVYGNHLFLYNLAPIILFAFLCLLPIMMNAYKNMLQYLSLSLFSFIFLGWGLMHLGWVLQKKDGVFLLFYLSILIEFFDNSNLTFSSLLKGRRFLPHINSHRTTSATLFAFILTAVTAFILQILLLEKVFTNMKGSFFWIVTSCLAMGGAMLGNLIMDIIRRDLGIRTTGVFILGKGDFINRMQRMVFTVPLYYYFINFIFT